MQWQLWPGTGRFSGAADYHKRLMMHQINNSIGCCISRKLLAAP
jgi:hypothetical protein